MTDKEKIEEIKKLAIKWSKISEYFDKLIMNDWVKMGYETQKCVNQIGNRLLKIIGD